MDCQVAARHAVLCMLLPAGDYNPVGCRVWPDLKRIVYPKPSGHCLLSTLCSSNFGSMKGASCTLNNAEGAKIKGFSHTTSTQECLAKSRLLALRASAALLSLLPAGWRGPSATSTSMSACAAPTTAQPMPHAWTWREASAASATGASFQCLWGGTRLAATAHPCSK